MINPRSVLTWWLELAPILLLLAILLLTYKRFPLTNITYTWLWISAIIVTVGGHYTYEEMPLFNRLQDKWHLSRNHYDRFGHFWKGFATVLVFRELLLRLTNLLQGKWLFGIIIGLSLATGALYELIEFAAALVAGGGADKFLGAQGDEWDAQWDMVLLLAGSLLAYPLVRGRHDRQLAKVFWREGNKEQV